MKENKTLKQQLIEVQAQIEMLRREGSAGEPAAKGGARTAIQDLEKLRRQLKIQTDALYAIGGDLSSRHLTPPFFLKQRSAETTDYRSSE